VLAFQVKSQVLLLPTDPIQFKVNAKSSSSIEMGASEGQSLNNVYGINTLNQSSNDGLILRYPIDSVVHEGDVLLLSFYSRSIQSKKETGESFIEVALDRFVNGKYNWPPLFERGMSFGSKWVLTQIPFIAGRDVAKGEMALMIKCGKFPQIFELKDISLLIISKPRI